MVKDNYIIEEAVRLVQDGVSVTLPVNGHSMLPFIIGGKESVVLQQPAQLKVGDVVLAWADNCRYVVNRIISISGDSIVLMGDGNIKGTEQCRRADVMAVATHVVGANEKAHYLYTPWRCRAARLWWHLRPVRRYILGVYRRM